MRAFAPDRTDSNPIGDLWSDGWLGIFIVGKLTANATRWASGRVVVDHFRRGVSVANSLEPGNLHLAPGVELAEALRAAEEVRLELVQLDKRNKPRVGDVRFEGRLQMRLA